MFILLLGDQDFVITISVHCTQTQPVSILAISLVITKDYPRCKPSLSLKCNRLVNDKIAQVKAACLAHFEADGYKDQPILLDIIQWLEQNIENYVTSKPDDSSDCKLTDGIECTILIQLDHMRSKKTYCNTLLSWWEQLRLYGRIIFYCSYIFLVVQGTKDAIKVQ